MPSKIEIRALGYLMAMDAAATGHQLESKDDIRKQEDDPKRAKVLRWLMEIENAERVFADYHARVDKILERYRDERATRADGTEEKADRKYNALWSMKETLKPLLFARTPVPFVTRMHDDDDPTGRDASLLLQRILKVASDNDNFYDALDEGVDDYTLGGRGVTWVTYLPRFGVRESEVPTYVESEDDVPEDEFAEEEGAKYKVQPDEEGKLYYREKIEHKVAETAILESVSSKDILHAPATKWRHVSWVARRIPMLRSELVKRFGKKVGGEIPLAAKEVSNPRSKTANTDDFKGQFQRAVVWEIWDKVDRRVIWICPDYKVDVLDEKEDGLDLEGFYPCPKPMFGTMTNDTMIPVPDYIEWQDIALDLDKTTHRISLLTDALRVAGVYSEEYGTSIEKLLSKTNENVMISVKNWAVFADKGGLKGAVDFMPLEMVINTLSKLYEVRARLVAELYEITGISDIVRGASDPRETAAAQKLKGNFANARLTARQHIVARHAREALSIIAEIVCTVYGDDTIKKLSGAEQCIKTPEGLFDEIRYAAALRMLRDEGTRVLRVKIDTEDLANESLLADREETTQFLQGLTTFMQASTQMLQIAPNLGGVLSKLILVAVRKFRVGRALESDIESSLRKLAETGLGQPMGEQGAAPDAGMNELEASVEMKKLAVQADKNQVAREGNQIKATQLQLTAKRDNDASGARQRDLNIKEFKVVSDVQRDKQQLGVQVQQHQDQISIQREEAQTERAMEGQRMAHEQEMGEREFAASRADTEHEQALHRAEFNSTRDDADRNFDASREDARTNASIKRAQSRPKV